MARLSFRCDEELVQLVDATRGDVSRERWLRRAVVRMISAEGGGDSDAWRAQAAQLAGIKREASEQALGSSGRAGVRGRVPALPPAEQPRSEGVMEFDDKGRMTRLEGTYAPQVRSSAEARPFRPVPKKGEK